MAGMTESRYSLSCAVQSSSCWAAVFFSSSVLTSSVMTLMASVISWTSAFSALASMPSSAFVATVVAMSPE